MQAQPSIQYAVLGGLLAIGIISLTIAVDWLLGWGEIGIY